MFQGIYKNKKILVTGHTGFKGAWLTQWLLSLGADVCGYSKDIPGKPNLFELLKIEKDILHTVGDVRDLDSLKKTFSEFRPDYVFHLAAQAFVRRSYDEPVETFGTNVMGTVNVLEAVRFSENVQMGVIVTTDKCYLNLESKKDFTEEDKLGGNDPYSASKAASEIVFHGYWKSFFEGKKSTALASGRAGNVIGGGDWSEDRLVPDCLREWTENKTVTLRSPQAIRPWQHVLDALNGYLTLGMQLVKQPGKTNGEAYNFGPDNSSRKSVGELVEELQKTWKNAQVKVDQASTAAKKESQYLFLSSEKARKVLDWKPILGFEKAVSTTADWYREYYGKTSASDLVVKQITEFEKQVRAN